MARYSAFLGRPVDVQYRAGDICLPASGTFVGDSGRSIFLEQRYEQHGQTKMFRWEIPYQCVVRMESVEDSAEADSSDAALATRHAASPETSLHASAAHASAGASFLPVTHRSKTA